MLAISEWCICGVGGAIASAIMIVIGTTIKAAIPRRKKSVI